MEGKVNKIWARVLALLLVVCGAVPGYASQDVELPVLRDRMKTLEQLILSNPDRPAQ